MFAFLLGRDAALSFPLMIGIVGFRVVRDVHVGLCVPLVYAPGVPANVNDPVRR